ncbi:MAG: DNA repair protein RecO [Patescibacteria group bacterium]|jgi:DNA repair protein RecO (recombination protein O)
MAVIKTKGIIIRRINLGEADRILTILTADRGKIRVVARGVRRANAKLSGFLELFRYNEYLLAEGRNLDIITGAATIENFRQISLNLRKIGLAYYVAEISDRLVEETQEADQVFDLVYTALKEINANKLPLDFVKSFFEFNILSVLGFKPELTKCIVCEKPIDLTQKTGFSVTLGGLIDRDHLFSDPSAIMVDQLVAKTLCLMTSAPLKHFHTFEQLSEVTPQIAQISANFLDYMMEKNLRSKEFLEEVLEF